MMDQAKSKSVKVLHKLTSPERKTHQLFNDISNYRTYLDTKQTAKPTKHISRQRNSAKQLTSNPRHYLFNKTANGTPSQKSAMLSYLSTPNQKSCNLQALKMLRSDGRTFKIRDEVPSTEDDHFGQVIKVSMLLPNNKTHSKYFPLQSNPSSVQQHFKKIILEFYTKSKMSIYGMIGFETVPFNYQLTQIINSQSPDTFKKLSQLQFKQLAIIPCLLQKIVSYESLDFSDFQIIKHLGSGGFSQVFLARCRIDHQYCALKFIRKDTITSAKKVKMLENQKNILFTVKHQNLVDLMYAFQTKHFIVFGLEYCPNGNLYSYLKKHRTLSEGQAKNIMNQILNGLDYLHNTGVIFRDIKLQNILFDVQGNIKITDFGLSKPDLEEDQITYSYCGSPQYMAPEMLAKAGHSFQVDYYALGILLYELLYGRSPFYASKKQDIFLAILHSQPRFPKNPEVSKEVKNLIKGLLAKNPNHRIGSLKGIKQILSHPWFKTQKTQILSVTENSLFQNTNQGKKQAQQNKEMFINQQSDKKFQKIFFVQNFVNKTLFQKILSKTYKFQQIEKANKSALLKRIGSKGK